MKQSGFNKNLCRLLGSIILLAGLSACGGGGGGGGGGSNVPPPINTEDTTPDIFSFNSISDVDLNTRYISDPITIDGINSATAIEVVGGEYSIDDADFSNEAGLVNVGQRVRMQLTSSAEFSTTVSATLNVGGIEGVFSVTTQAEDASPDAFSFDQSVDVLPQAEVTSEPVIIEGINTDVIVEVTQGKYSIDDGDFTDQPGIIRATQRLRLQHVASDEYGDQTETEVTVGDYTARFVSTTATNTAPVAADVEIITAQNPAFVGDVLTGSYTYRDSEGDDEAESLYRWYRNDTLINGATALTYTLVAADVNSNIYFEVVPQALTGIPGGDALRSLALSVGNRPPEAQSLQINDENGGRFALGDIITASYVYRDAEGDIEAGSRIQWLRDGLAIDGETQRAYTLTNADVDLPISFSVIPLAASGTIRGDEVVSLAITLENYAPEATQVVIGGTTDNEANVGATLNGEYAYDDADGDAEGLSEFQWYRNGTPITGETSQQYVVAAEDSGKVLRFEVTPVASSGTQRGLTVQSAEVQINAQPRALDLEITTENSEIAVGSLLIANYDYRDEESDAEGGSVIRWLRDGVVIEGENATEYRLVEADSGQSITFVVIPHAQTGSSPGEQVTSPPVATINLPPVARDLQIVADEFVVGAELEASYAYVDNDGDAESQSQISWYRNGVAIDGATENRYRATFDDNAALLSFSVTPGADNSAVGDTVYSNPIAINAVPSASGVQIALLSETTTPNIGGVLFGEYTFSDAENDQERSTYRWYRNDAVIDGAESRTYVATADDLGYDLSFEVVPGALTGSALGLPVRSAAVTIENAAPVALNVAIVDGNGGLPEAGDRLIGTYSYADLEGDPELHAITVFAWTLQGDEEDTILSTGRTYTLTDEDLGRGIIVFSVTPVAATGTSVGATVSSEALALNNRAPVASDVVVQTGDGGAVIGEQLSVSFTYTDDENDEAGEHIYQWLRDGVRVPNATASSYVITPQDGGHTLSVELIPVAQSGAFRGLPVRSGGIAVNALPVAQNTRIVEFAERLAVGDQISGSYSYFDNENDAESGTTYRWLRDGQVIEGATQLDYQLSTEDNGKSIAFEVIPRASSGSIEGIPALSGSVAINNVAPVASNVDFSGGNNGAYLTGDILTASYQYSDADDDPQGDTVFRWLRNGDDVVGTGQRYTITASDSGYDLSVSVTPVAQSGALVGESVTSRVISVANLAPQAENVIVISSNGVVAFGDVLLASYRYEDREGDLEGNSTIQWLRNGEPIDGADEMFYIVSEGDSATEISFTVTPLASAGEPEGETVTSPTVTVVDTPPVVFEANIVDDNGGFTFIGDVLTASYRFDDVDGHVEEASRIRWLRGDSDVIDGIDGLSYTLTAEDIAIGTISVGVTPVANGIEGTEAIYSLALDDTVPDPITFDVYQDAAPDTFVESVEVVIGGLGAGVTLPVSIDGGVYSINGGAYTDVPATVALGDSVKVGLQSLEEFGASAQMRLTIGTAVSPFTVLTKRNSPPTWVVDAERSPELLANLGPIPLTSLTWDLRGPVDLDGDGDLDILLLTPDGLDWLESDGDPVSPEFVSQPIATDMSFHNSFTESPNIDIGDIDNDGDMDILAVADDQNLLWFENRLDIDGTFTQREVSSDYLGLQARLGDIDGDGDKDILLAAWIHGVVLYTNDGGANGDAPEFSLSSTLLVDDVWSDAIDVGDVDGDGDLDIVHIGTSAGWFENQQEDGFVQNDIEFEPESFAEVLLQDINADSYPDIVVRSIADTEELLWLKHSGDEDPTFALSEYPIFASNTPDEYIRFSLGDRENDGDTDILMVRSDELFWLENDGSDEPFVATDVINLTPAQFVLSSSSMDITMDGQSDSLWLSFGRFAGSSDRDILIYWLPSNTAQFSVVENRIHEWPLEANDIDDHPLEYSIYGGADQDFFEIDANTGALSFEAPAFDSPADADGNNLFEVGVSVSDGLSVINRFITVRVLAADADADGDGVPNALDAFPLDAEESVDTDGDGQGDNRDTDDDNDGIDDTVDSAPRDSAQWSLPAWDTPQDVVSYNEITSTLAAGALSLMVADMNSDDRLDILVNAEGISSLVYFTNTPEAPETFTPRLITGDEPLGQVTDIDVADINGDGHMDILIGANTRQRIGWYIFDVDVNSYRYQSVSDEFFTSSVSASDVDGDDRLDVVAATSSGIVWFKNIGESEPLFDVPQMIGDFESAIFFAMDPADIDGNDSLDVFAGALWSNKVSWFENDGAAEPQFSEIIIEETEDGMSSALDVRVADLDDDGDQDLVVASWSEGLLWYENDGAVEPTFTQHKIGESLNLETVYSLHVDDVDADGDLDIFSSWRLTPDLTNTLGWFENDGSDEPNFVAHIFPTGDEDDGALATNLVQSLDINDDGDKEMLAVFSGDDPANPEVPRYSLSWFSAVQRQFTAIEGEPLIIPLGASDEDDSTLTYSLIGIDSEYFTVDPDTGMVTFSDAPTIADPQDSNRDNIYKATVRVSDGHSELSRMISVEVIAQGT